MDRQTLFVDVILPLPVPNLYTYRVPHEWNEYVKTGQRVVVQFGKNKLYTALVRRIHENAPEKYVAKYLDNILDEFPIVNAKQFALWDWISDYYMCNPGEVMNAALPGNLKLSSETKILLHPDFNKETAELNENEKKLLDALEIRTSLTIEEIAGILEIKTVQPLLKKMIDKKIITSEEEIKNKYKPKFDKFISLNSEYDDEKKLGELMNKLEKKAPRQVDALMGYLHHTRYATGRISAIKKTDLTKELGEDATGINALVKKKIFSETERRTDRLYQDNIKTIQASPLSPAQQRAYNEIQEQFREKDTVLLHGITSSGKTEIYIHLAEKTIREGKQVVYLLPEIALTAQIISRLKKHFGNEVGVYHSRFNEQERVEIWNKSAHPERNGYKLVIGARSALFLPFSNVGLIIVDEEHEQTFKQHSPAPRYHARDAAVVLAKIHGAKLLMGSATPGLETYYNASTGKYGLVELNERFGGVQLPEVFCADMKEARRRKELKAEFSQFLIDKITDALNKKEQVILFQNRRGYTPFWSCEDCGWIPKCSQCDVSLTYHKKTHQLICHYCASTYKPHSRCNACGSSRLRMVGFGTEKIEEELEIIFPSARIARMDLDTTRTKNAHFNLIQQFEDREVDILVGTQMVTKGLDFEHVSLVGIINADNILNFPDFRSFERGFQLFSQVAGRAGRKNKRGEVVIQCSDPYHTIIQKVVEHNYKKFYKDELSERKKFFYPPFSRLIHLQLKHKQEEVVHSGAAELAKKLQKKLGKRLLGPEKPLVGKVRNYYLMNILIKLEKNQTFGEYKKFIRETLDEFNMFSDFKSVRVDIDVDPV